MRALLSRLTRPFRQDLRLRIRPGRMELAHPFRVNSKHQKSAPIRETLTRRDDAAFAFAARIRDAKKSMLAIQTLAAMYRLASECDGPIIEIGAYIGGATLALLEATKERRNPVISIEFGVAYDHPEIPT